MMLTILFTLLGVAVGFLIGFRAWRALDNEELAAYRRVARRSPGAEEAKP